jgi:hypothetical protein
VDSIYDPKLPEGTVNETSCPGAVVERNQPWK